MEQFLSLGGRADNSNNNNNNLNNNNIRYLYCTFSIRDAQMRITNKFVLRIKLQGCVKF